MLIKGISLRAHKEEKTIVKRNKIPSKLEVRQRSTQYHNNNVSKQNVLNTLFRLVKVPQTRTLTTCGQNIDDCADIGYTHASRSLLKPNDTRISITPLSLINKPLEK